MKRNCLVIVTLILISSLLLTPVQASITTYVWDTIHFVEGTGIDYPHADRDYYDISISSEWKAAGTKLYHIQFDHDTSAQAGVGIEAACVLIGVAIGVMATPIVGTVTGIVLFAMAAGAMIELLDEEGCVWFWISVSFVNWLIDNAWWLVPLCILCPLAGAEEIMLAFLVLGYFRIGSATIYDVVGAGTPSAPPPPPDPALSISIPFGHGITDPAEGTHEYDYGETVIVTAIPDPYYNFSYWKLDDDFSTDNPITITMDCDHTLRCQFKQAGSGNGGGGGGGHYLEGDNATEL